MHDLVAVKAYVERDFETIDAALRSIDQAKLKELDAHIRLASYGLFQLPDVRGPVFRGAQLPKEVLAKYTPGTIVLERSFVSTSANPAVRFAGNALYVIDSVNGRNASLLAKNQVEQEVVFFTGTRFEVLAMDLSPGERIEHTVYLREIPDPRLLKDPPLKYMVNEPTPEQRLDALRRARSAREQIMPALRFPVSGAAKYRWPIGMNDERMPF